MKPLLIVSFFFFEVWEFGSDHLLDPRNLFNYLSVIPSLYSLCVSISAASRRLQKAQRGSFAAAVILGDPAL